MTRPALVAPDLDSKFRPAPHEWVFLFLFLAACLVFNIATCRWYPAVWADEVSFSEPAINFVKTGEFVTRVWPYQPENTFPSLNCPLYSMTLAGWLSVTGTSLLAVRSLNYLLAGLAGFLIWLISWRFNLVRQPVGRLALAGLVELGYGMSAAFRGSRPDMLGALLVLLLVLAVGVKARRRQALLIMLISAAAVWTGLQVALAIGLAGLIAWLTFKPVSVWDLLPAALGGALGVLLLILFLNHHQALSYFMISVQCVTDRRLGAHLSASFLQSLGKLIFQSLHSYVDDMSLAPLLIGTILCGLAVRHNLSQQCQRLVWFLILLMLIIPLVFNATGHFGIFYSYLVFFPASLLFLVLFEQMRATGAWSPGVSQLLFIGVIGSSLALGLPLRLAISRTFCRLQTPEQIRQVLTEAIHPGAIVFMDYTAFFEARQVTPNIYVVNQIAPDNQRFTKIDLGKKERDSISVLITKPEQKNDYLKWLGGNWEASGQIFGNRSELGPITNLPVIGKKITSYFNQQPNSFYQLEILHRSSNPSSDNTRPKVLGGTSKQVLPPPDPTPKKP